MVAPKGNGYAKKYTDKQIDDILEGVLDYAMNSDAIYITSYLWKKYKKPKYWLHDLARTYPKVKEAIPQIKALIANKIANHCFKGDRNSTFGERILPMYCDEYTKETERKAELNKTNQQDQPTQVIINVDDYSNAKIEDECKQKK